MKSSQQGCVPKRTQEMGGKDTGLKGLKVTPPRDKIVMP